MRVLLLDLTHGGDILTSRFIENGDEVTCVDVYGISTQEQRDSLTALGARVLREVPPESFDLLASPAHCPDRFLNGATYGSRITFSGAVNRFVDNPVYRIEVTGVKGKTSTCYLLTHMLDRAGKKVYLHTSRGSGPYVGGKHDIQVKMSIAPTSILKLPTEGYDVVVCEVSLGGSAKADISVITNLVEDYGIAKNTRKASDAKAEILNPRKNIVIPEEREFWSKYGKPIASQSASVTMKGDAAIGSPIECNLVYNGRTADVRLRGDYLALQYLPAMGMAASVCESMGIPEDAVIQAIESFAGVPGRGEISQENGVWKVTERNPGISHISIGRTLATLKEMHALDGAFAIVDPVSKKVCDKMDSAQIKDVLDSYNVKYAFTDGMGSEPEVPKDAKTVIRFVKEGFQ